mmetsp:Transcript_9104/g.29168  ORF Transcript_9104/g.29168 Transcript_9104/m.29168 type:complete len:313 (-) Transcript_9104:263-1201(-)
MTVLASLMWLSGQRRQMGRLYTLQSKVSKSVSSASSIAKAHPYNACMSSPTTKMRHPDSATSRCNISCRMRELSCVSSAKTHRSSPSSRRKRPKRRGGPGSSDSPCRTGMCNKSSKSRTGSGLAFFPLPSSHTTSPGSASHAEFSAQWMLAPKHLRAMLRPASSRDTAVGHLAFACAVRVLESLFLRTSSMPSSSLWRSHKLAHVSLLSGRPPSMPTASILASETIFTTKDSKRCTSSDSEERDVSSAGFGYISRSSIFDLFGTYAFCTGASSAAQSSASAAASSAASSCSSAVAARVDFRCALYHALAPSE